MKNIFKKIEYNSPVVLTYAILCTIIFFINQILSIESINSMFVYYGGFSGINLIKLFTWPLGHASIDHLMGNMMIILLIGPMIEEKYSSKVLLALMLITTILIGICHSLFITGGILGASGVVFMMIMLTTFTNMKDGKIPLTFIFIVFLYLGKEIYNGLFVENDISELGHILGAVVGMLNVFLDQKVRKK